MNEEKFFICDRVDDHGDDGAKLLLQINKNEGKTKNHSKKNAFSFGMLSTTIFYQLFQQ